MNEPCRKRPKTLQTKKTPHMKMRSKYMERLKGIPRKPPNTIQSEKPMYRSGASPW
jgi:hypothetical protein